MKCFYHNDNDGIMAAKCVHAWVGINPFENYYTSEFISINYNQKFPFDSIKKNEQVWIVDYSIEPDEMRKLLTITKDVIWIDHHKTAIEKYKGFEHLIKGIRKDGEAGCVLAFKYINWYTNRGGGDVDLTKERKDIPIPRAIELVGDRDIWAWKFGDETKYFCLGLSVLNMVPESPFLFDLITHKEKELIPQIIEKGKVISQFKKLEDRKYIKNWSFVIDFDGHTCIVCNKGSTSSEFFGDGFNLYDMAITFCSDGKCWSISMYSQTIDVSKIAKKYGGGGHTGAAGFICNELPFKKII